jgi:hypothetical protein
MRSSTKITFPVSNTVTAYLHCDAWLTTLPFITQVQKLYAFPMISEGDSYFGLLQFIGLCYNFKLFNNKYINK